MNASSTPLYAYSPMSAALRSNFLLLLFCGAGPALPLAGLSFWVFNSSSWGFTLLAVALVTAVFYFMSRLFVPDVGLEIPGMSPVTLLRACAWGGYLLLGAALIYYLTSSTYSPLSDVILDGPTIVSGGGTSAGFPDTPQELEEMSRQSDIKSTRTWATAFFIFAGLSLTVFVADTWRFIQGVDEEGRTTWGIKWLKGGGFLGALLGSLCRTLQVVLVFIFGATLFWLWGAYITFFDSEISSECLAASTDACDAYSHMQSMTSGTQGMWAVILAVLAILIAALHGRANRFQHANNLEIKHLIVEG